MERLKKRKGRSAAVGSLETAFETSSKNGSSNQPHRVFRHPTDSLVLSPAGEGVQWAGRLGENQTPGMDN